MEKENHPIGVLLINLGTPKAPTTKAVRTYLAEFLSDPRIAKKPRLLWWLILYGFILPTRPRRSAKLYQKIWTEAGSPLLVITKQLADNLQTKLQDKSVSIKVAMRYGQPSIQNALEAFREEKIGRILTLPLYPQYASPTTASTFDAIAKTFQHRVSIPEIRTINGYANDENYITAIAESIKKHWHEQGKAEKLIFSFHGLPKKSIESGDPYYFQCQETAKLMTQALQLEDKDWLITFQSRVGPAEWLKPYTDETLKQLPQQGIHSVDIICPGFAVDCLETLEEIAMTNRDVFLQAGGKDYRYIPALNASDQHVDLLMKLIQRHIQGW